MWRRQCELWRCASVSCDCIEVYCKSLSIDAYTISEQEPLLSRSTSHTIEHPEGNSSSREASKPNKKLQRNEKRVNEDFHPDHRTFCPAFVQLCAVDGIFPSEKSTIIRLSWTNHWHLCFFFSNQLLHISGVPRDPVCESIILNRTLCQFHVCNILSRMLKIIRRVLDKIPLPQQHYAVNSAKHSVTLDVMACWYHYDVALDDMLVSLWH